MDRFQSLDEVVAAFRRRAWLIVLVTFIGVLVSLNIALGQTKIYEATAVIQIEDAQVSDTLSDATTPEQGQSRRVRLIEQRLMSRDNLMQIMEKHGLFVDIPDLSATERLARMRESARIEQIVNPGAYGAGEQAPSGLRITVSLNDPNTAAAVANDLMYSVIEQSRDRATGRARDALAFFRSEEERIEAEIAEQEEEIAQYKREHAEALPAGIDGLRDQLASLRETELEIERQILALEGNTVRTRDEVRDREGALLQEQQALVSDRIDEIQRRISESPEVERELNRLERELTSLQEQYTVIARRKAEAEMSQILESREQGDRFEVLETALAPEMPSSRSRKKLAMMGGVASIFAAVALALAVELMNPAIRTAAHMERALGLQPVVSIPEVRDPSGGGRRGPGLRWVAGLALGIVGLLVAIRVIGDGLPLTDYLGRLLPRGVEG